MENNDCISCPNHEGCVGFLVSILSKNGDICCTCKNHGINPCKYGGHCGNADDCQYIHN